MKTMIGRFFVWLFGKFKRRKKMVKEDVISMEEDFNIDKAWFDSMSDNEICAEFVRLVNAESLGNYRYRCEWNMAMRFYKKQIELVKNKKMEP